MGARSCEGQVGLIFARISADHSPGLDLVVVGLTVRFEATLVEPRRRGCTRRLCYRQSSLQTGCDCAVLGQVLGADYHVHVAALLVALETDGITWAEVL